VESTLIAESLTDTISSRVKRAEELLNDNPEASLKLVSEELDEFPGKTIAAFIATKCFISLKRPGLAQAMAKQVVSQWPNHAGSWVNLAQAFQLSYDLDAAKQCLEKALTLKPIEADATVALENLSLVYCNLGEPEMAMEYAHRALALRDDNGTKETMGFAHLRLHKWTPGWHYYNYGLGMTSDRKVRNYNGAPVWQGERGTVVLYGEQGIGDEICFAQVVPQMIKDCDLIIDTCASLQKLFQSSFDCPVHGTRYVDELPWLDKVDYCLSFGQAMEMYRGKNENFTGKPYLKANPEKRKWWKAILAQYPGKKVGVAWNAGIPETGKKKRTLSLEDVLLLDDGSTFVSLEYKNNKKDIEWLKSKGMNILDFGMFINGHKNYEDTAALVSELDHVIAPATTVVDLCGALGQSCDTLVPTIPHWRQHGENVWYNSVNYVRQQGSWADTIRGLHAG
jgi:tetratricopeptide (TPR) repeat protein